MLTLKLDPKTHQLYLMIGNKKYLIKDTVSKKRLASFVNGKLKSLGYKAKKFKFIKRKPAKVKVNVAAAPKGPRGAPRAAAPRGPRGPSAPIESSKKKGFPIGRKTTEQELEELQKRRDPENIELYQLSKDNLIDLAKKAGIISPSGMTKIQLIQAIQKSKITKDDVSQLIIQNEIKNIPATEYAYLEDSGLNAMDMKDLREYVKEIRKDMKNPAMPKIKFNGDTSRIGYIKAIFNWEKAKEALEEAKDLHRDDDKPLGPKRKPAPAGISFADSAGVKPDIENKHEELKGEVKGEVQTPPPIDTQAYNPITPSPPEPPAPPPTSVKPIYPPFPDDDVILPTYDLMEEIRRGAERAHAERVEAERAHAERVGAERAEAEAAEREAAERIEDEERKQRIASLWAKREAREAAEQQAQRTAREQISSTARASTPSKITPQMLENSEITVEELKKIRKTLIEENSEASKAIKGYGKGVTKQPFLDSIKEWVKSLYSKQPDAVAAYEPDINTADDVGNQDNKDEGDMNEPSLNENNPTASIQANGVARGQTANGRANSCGVGKANSCGVGKANSCGVGKANANNKKFGIDNHSIDRFLSKYGDEYLGCIAHDEIPSKIYPKIKPRSRGFFVINTDPSWKSGCHWQCVFYDARPQGSGSIEFYDSFADPIDPKMQADLKGIAERLDAKTYLKLKENRIKQQNDNSDNCGYFCMNFITSRMRGKGFPEASGFDESVQGESDINKFKKMNGFGFLPSFGSIASTLQRPFNTIKEALRDTAGRVQNVAQRVQNVATNIKETVFFPEKKLPSSIQPIFEKYKNYKIISFQIRREPILAFVDKFINFISFGKFNEAKKDLGYDKMFHLSLILQLGSAPGGGENGPGSAQGGVKLLIEKNERINMTLNWKDGNQVQYFPASGSLQMPGNPTLGEFYDRTLKAVGDHRFFTYNAFAQNCQAFIADLLRSNNSLSNDAQNFVMQDSQTVIKQLPFYVSKVAQFTTDTAGRVRQFFGFGTGSGYPSDKRLKQNAQRMQSRALRKQKYENFMRQQSCMK